MLEFTLRLPKGLVVGIWGLVGFIVFTLRLPKVWFLASISYYSF